MTRRVKNILLVEDEVADAALVRATLGASGEQNRIHHVENGVEALRFLRREPPYEDAPLPDLVLLDLNMPLLDGHATLERIRKDKQVPFVPVIVMTSSARKDEIARSYELGANCYVRKSLDFDEFQTNVRSIESFWLGVAALPVR
ncbi:MAG: response regulator [Myxococcota bacterium]